MAPDDFISCHGQGQGTPHQSLQLKEDGLTIIKKSLITTKKHQDRGQKIINALVLSILTASKQKMYTNKLA